MSAARNSFNIVVAIALLILLFASVDADFRRGENCQCFFIGDCAFDEHGVGYRYHLCRGSCAAYSSWWTDTRCVPPQVIPLPQNQNSS